MPIEIRPDQSALVHLVDDPKFDADLEALEPIKLTEPPAVVLDFGAVRHINSSGIARLLRLRKRLIQHHGKLLLCAMNLQAVTVFQATGLDKIFHMPQS